jgi:hypothetical protein
MEGEAALSAEAGEEKRRNRKRLYFKSENNDTES